MIPISINELGTCSGWPGDDPDRGYFAYALLHFIHGVRTLEPDAVYELRLDLWATANVFLPDHRIRLEVSSSNFPRFARNSNTGREIAREAAKHYRAAINRIFHDAAHLSRLIPPIIER